MKTAKQLLSDANSSENKITKLRKQKEIQEEKISKAGQLIRSNQYDEVRKIEEKYRAQQKKINEQKEKEDELFKKEFDGLVGPRTNLRKTIYFLRNLHLIITAWLFS